MMFFKIRWVLATFGILFLSACKVDSPLTQLNGRYEGTFVQHTQDQWNKPSVRTEIQQAKDHLPEVQITTRTLEPTLDIQVLALGEHAVTLKLLGLPKNFSQWTTLSLELLPAPAVDTSKAERETSACYREFQRDRQKFHALLCPSADELKFDFDDLENGNSFSLSLYHFAPEVSVEPTPEESPRVFKMTEAIDRARKMSFPSRIEFEHVIQAGLSSKAGYRKLTPQLTMNTIANLVTPSLSTVFATLGDLLPFLLPSRWHQASRLDHLYQAEKDAEKTMRLDMGLQIEGLFYQYDRDQNILRHLNETMLEIKKIADEVKIRENLGGADEGSYAALLNTIKQINDTVTSAQVTLVLDRAALSQALGFYKPATVQEMEIDAEEQPIESASEDDVHFDAINEEALAKSFELDQLVALRDAKAEEKQFRIYSWLDPNEDPTYALGAALPIQLDELESEKREANELIKSRKQMLTQNSVFPAITSYQSSIKLFAQAKDLEKDELTRISQARLMIAAGKKIEFANLVSTLQDYLGAKIQSESARATFRTARAQLDRLLLHGNYARF